MSSTALGERKMWSDPILIEIQSPGTLYVVEKRRIGHTSMATKITQTAILANSRYEED